ncbi:MULTISPECIES: O-antigen ligase family protein [unclassified Clostridium]|uniref:O-antigen ligase family protein n=1 Tax=unclassified Clostridium TaxID=2614128 RepID=UPI0002972A21|nr:MULTISPECIES: O-antigen ligase family protein [unclassified Clostridium]EKQ53582.1 MAG: lipid A core-O-antigen ligase-like enyme [Clostridium sp. Maddingley MBC34-26]
MKEIIKNIYDFLNKKLYFKLLYLFVSLTYVTILKPAVPKILLLGNVAQVWGILLIIFLVFENYKRRKIYKFDIPLGIFMILTFIFTMIAYRNIENIKIWIVNLLLFTIIFSVDVFRNRKVLIKELNIITGFYAVFMFIASLSSLIMRFTGTTIEMGQVIYGGTKGVFENENALAIASALALVMCIYLNSIAQNHKPKMFWTANMIIQIINMVGITMIGGHDGRSAFLIVGGVLYAFIFMLNKSKYFRIACILIPIIAGGVFLTHQSNVRNFTSGRTSLWQSAAIVIEKHPLTGVGYNDLVEAVRNARETDDLPGLDAGRLHNVYVETAAENGIISLLLLLTFIVMILTFIIQHLDKLLRKEKLQMTTLTSLVVGILIVNLFESTLIYIVSFMSMIFWIYLGYLVSILDNKNIE